MTGGSDGQILIYNENLTLVHSFQAHSKSITRLKQSPSNNFANEMNLAASSSSDTTVKIWSSLNWTLIRTHSNHTASVGALEWINEDLIASGGSFDQTIQIWSISTGQTKRIIQTWFFYVMSLKLLSNQIHLAAGFGQGPISVYNINTGDLVVTLQGHTANVNDIILVNQIYLASSSNLFENTVRLWDLAKNETKFILTGHVSGVFGLKQIASDLLASGSFDSTIKVWNLTTGGLIRTLKGHKSAILNSIDLINNGQVLVSGSQDKTLKLWNWKTGECLNTKDTSGTAIQTLNVFNPIKSKKNFNGKIQIGRAHV